MSVVIVDLKLLSFEAVDGLDGRQGRCALKPRGGAPWILISDIDQPVFYSILVNVI